MEKHKRIAQSVMDDGPSGSVYDTTLSEYNYRVVGLSDDEKRILITKLRRKYRKQHDE